MPSCQGCHVRSRSGRYAVGAQHHPVNVQWRPTFLLLLKGTVRENGRISPVGLGGLLFAPRSERVNVLHVHSPQVHKLPTASAHRKNQISVLAGKSDFTGHFSGNCKMIYKVAALLTHLP